MDLLKVRKLIEETVKEYEIEMGENGEEIFDDCIKVAIYIISSDHEIKSEEIDSFNNLFEGFNEKITQSKIENYVKYVKKKFRYDSIILDSYYSYLMSNVFSNRQETEAFLNKLISLYLFVSVYAIKSDGEVNNLEVKAMHDVLKSCYNMNKSAFNDYEVPSNNEIQNQVKEFCLSVSSQ